MSTNGRMVGIATVSIKKSRELNAPHSTKQDVQNAIHASRKIVAIKRNERIVRLNQE